MNTLIYRPIQLFGTRNKSKDLDSNPLTREHDKLLQTSLDALLDIPEVLLLVHLHLVISSTSVSFGSAKTRWLLLQPTSTTDKQILLNTIALLNFCLVNSTETCIATTVNQQKWRQKLNHEIINML